MTAAVAPATERAAITDDEVRSIVENVVLPPCENLGGCKPRPAKWRVASPCGCRYLLCSLHLRKLWATIKKAERARARGATVVTTCNRCDKDIDASAITRTQF